MYPGDISFWLSLFNSKSANNITVELGWGFGLGLRIDMISFYRLTSGSRGRECGGICTGRVNVLHLISYETWSALSWHLITRRRDQRQMKMNVIDTTTPLPPSPPSSSSSAAAAAAAVRDEVFARLISQALAVTCTDAAWLVAVGCNNQRSLVSWSQCSNNVVASQDILPLRTSRSPLRAYLWSLTSFIIYVIKLSHLCISTLLCAMICSSSLR